MSLLRRGILADALVVGGGPTVSDTFTRADAPTLGTTETGQPWVMTTNDWTVVGNQAQAPATGSGYQGALVDAGMADVDVAYTVDPVASDPNDGGIMARYTDLGNHILLDLTWLSGRWLGRVFQKVGGGGYSGLSTLVDPVVPLSDSGSPFRVRLVVDGSGGEWFVTSQADLATWVSLGTFTGVDAGLTSTVHGMAFNNGVGVRADAFTISAAP